MSILLSFSQKLERLKSNFYGDVYNGNIAAKHESHRCFLYKLKVLATLVNKAFRKSFRSHCHYRHLDCRFLLPLDGLMPSMLDWKYET